MKYNSMIKILRRSKPVLNPANNIEEKVIDRIIRKTDSRDSSPGILDILFGWVYIRWVRSGLVAASLILILIFVYQQGVILKRINNLNRQSVFVESQFNTVNMEETDASYLYRITGRKIFRSSITISEKQMNRLVKSYSDLEKKYQDLVRLIEDDPELMKYVEEKLGKGSKNKLKL